MATKNRKTVYAVLAVVIVLLGIISYRIYANIAANKERAGRVAQGRVFTVEAAAVSRRDIQPVLTFSANLEPVWSADISPKQDGRIDHLYVDEGDYVSAGSLIAVFDTNELYAQVVQAEGNLLSNRAALEQAELDLSRTEALAKQGAVSAQALDTARIKRDLAIGQVRSAQGNLDLLQARLENAHIFAPRDGVVVKRYLQSGFFAKSGSAIVSIADTSSLLAKATVGEAQIVDVALGVNVNVKLSALSDKVFAGVVTRISPAALVPARAFTAEITIPNLQGELRPGMYAKTEVPGAMHKNALVVPESALVMREDQKTVFVLLPDNKVQQHVLKLGYVGDGWAEVLDGLTDQDRIVVAGQNKIKDGSSVKLADGKDGAAL